MQIVAKVTISNSNFEDWSAFFDSYKDKRSEFVKNETVEKINDTEARVTFEITDLEGLTHFVIFKRDNLKRGRIGRSYRNFIIFAVLGIFRAS